MLTKLILTNVAAAIVLVMLTNASLNSNNEDFTYRLPADTRPLNYSLTLTIYMVNLSVPVERFSYTGNVFMTLEVVEPTDVITMHGKGFTIKLCELRRVGQLIEWVDNKQPQYNLKGDFLTFRTKFPLQPGVYSLYISFEGRLRTDGRGMYRTSYEDKNHDLQWLVATHFEPIYARTAFPCYDEPALRVPMTLIIYHGYGFKPIGVTPIDKTYNLTPDWQETIFKLTPDMPTSALGFFLSNLDYLGVESSSFVPQRLFARSAAISENNEDFSYRLPTDTRPLSYSLTLITNIENRTNEERLKYSGNMFMWVEVVTPTDTIKMHGKDFTVNIAELKQAGEIISWIDDNQPQFDPQGDFLSFQAEELLEEGNYTMFISFEGELRNDSLGMYLTSYEDKNGELKWLISTRFEPVYARTAFPCYDEPGIRVPMTLSINHGNQHQAVGMALVDRINNLPFDRQQTLFKVTPNMPTSALGFVLSDFGHIGAESSKFIPQKKFARPAAIEDSYATLALHEGLILLKYLEIMLNAKTSGFYFSKIDQIALPDNTKALWDGETFINRDVIENWGTIIYPESFVLYDKTVNGVYKHFKTAKIIAEQYANQYVGVAVGPEWWDYLWVGKGLSVLLGHNVLHEAHPEFNAEQLMMANVVWDVLEYDADENVKPLMTYAENPAEIFKKFEPDIKKKSASIMKMIQHGITMDAFNLGIYYYINEMQYMGATADDLSRSLNKAAKDAKTIPLDLQVKDIIDSWSLKPGYPLIYVVMDNQANLKITQQRFLLSNETGTTSEPWIIPITISTASQPQFERTYPIVWMLEEELSLRPSTTMTWTTSDWIVLNNRQTGYYRVHYSEELRERLINLLQDDFTAIDPLNRAQLIDDIFQFAWTERVDIIDAIRLTVYSYEETEWIVWAAIDKAFTRLSRQLVDHQSHDYILMYINGIVNDLYQKLTVDDGGSAENLTTKLTRNIVIKWACASGDSDCLNKTSDKVLRLVDSSSNQHDIEPDLLEAVICGGVRDADTTLFEQVITKIMLSTDEDQRLNYIHGLACVNNPTVQNLYFDYSLRGVIFDPRERQQILYSISENGKNGLLSSIKFLTDHYQEVEDKFEAPSPTYRAVQKMAKYVSTEEILLEFKVLLKILINVEIITTDVENTLIKVAEKNVLWAEENDSTMIEFFEKYFSTDDANARAAPLMLLVIIVLVISFIF